MRSLAVRASLLAALAFFAYPRVGNSYVDIDCDGDGEAECRTPGICYAGPTNPGHQECCPNLGGAPGMYCACVLNSAGGACPAR